MTRLTPLALFLFTALAAAPAAAGEPAAAAHREAAGRIIGAALLSDTAYERLGYLCDTFGHRLSGSPRLEAAIAWAAAELRRDGFANVRTERVMVPHWVRGEEEAWLVEPQRHELRMLGLGGSVGTPEGGLRAEVVVVGSFDELEALGPERVEGKVVLYDVPFTTYGETVRYRVGGASRAARLGAVASLVRSVGPTSLDTPHTGGMRYSDDAPKIPTAAVTIENATMMRRMQERGQRPVLELRMDARTLPDAPSANVLADLPGRERPEEVVVIGGHIDSWDVGQGAQDDGAGCLIAWEAARLIQELGLRPRRTIRVVLFTNEENGIAGGRAYAEEHADELPRHVAAIESDSGNGPARGFRVDVPRFQGGDESGREAARAALTEDVLAALRELSPLLAPSGATESRPGGSGADVGPCVRRGVLGFGLDHDTTRYFEIHHTPADTFEKIDQTDLNRNVAAMAVMAYLLAEMPERLIEPADLELKGRSRSLSADRGSFSRR